MVGFPTRMYFADDEATNLYGIKSLSHVFSYPFHGRGKNKKIAGP
jgi:hypothetical protein